jgi:hypothetical protein
MNKNKRDNSFARQQQFDFMLPMQFLLICRLLQVNPRKVLYQFMVDLAHESYATGSEQKIAAKDYFMSCGYGLELYTDGEIEQLFDELDNIAALWPKNGPPKLVNLHARWRKRYYKYWYQKWYGRFRTKVVKMQ